MKSCVLLRLLRQRKPDILRFAVVNSGALQRDDLLNIVGHHPDSKVPVVQLRGVTLSVRQDGIPHRQQIIAAGHPAVGLHPQCQHCAVAERLQRIGEHYQAIAVAAQTLNITGGVVVLQCVEGEERATTVRHQLHAGGQLQVELETGARTTCLGKRHCDIRLLAGLDRHLRQFQPIVAPGRRCQ